MKTTVLTSKQIEQKVIRLAYQIYENNHEEKEIVLAGINGRGYLLAKWISRILRDISPLKVSLGELKMNKDNPLDEPIVFSLDEEALHGRVVLVVDDVVNSGKTLIHAVKHFLSFPTKKLRTLVMVDRSHNTYPVRADYIGISLSTSLREHVSVELEKGKATVFLQ
ncbi:phosphoribosyltransferase [Flavobacteriales bacterium AH-315-E23]|nr:phosphoribosyltransferase [Flavobacteriales bacterium AH-315-E23]